MAERGPNMCTASFRSLLRSMVENCCGAAFEETSGTFAIESGKESVSVV